MDLKNEQELKKVIKGCKKEDGKYQKLLFESLSGKMMVVCMRYSSDRETANDMLQEGFIKLFKNLTKYRFEGSFDGWVRKIFFNTAMDHLKAKKRLKESFKEETDFPIFVEDGFDEELDSTTLQEVKTEKILQEIQDLPISYRVCFNMKVFEGMTHQEIAENLGIHVGTSKSNYYKAKKRLIKNLS